MNAEIEGSGISGKKVYEPIRLVKALGGDDPKNGPRNRVLEYLFRQRDSPFSYDTLCAETSLEKEQVEKILEDLARKGILIKRDVVPVLNVRHPLVKRIHELDQTIRAKTETSEQKVYRERFEGYQIKFELEGLVELDAACDILDVNLTTKDGKDYWTTFTTMQYLFWIFEKNKETGELLSGTYFCMPHNMIIVQRLDKNTIRKTIDDLVNNCEIDDYLRKDD